MFYSVDKTEAYTQDVVSQITPNRQGGESEYIDFCLFRCLQQRPGTWGQGQRVAAELDSLIADIMFAF